MVATNNNSRKSSEHIASSKPLIVAIGGTTKTGSSTDRALRAAVAATEAIGARTEVFDGQFLMKLPIYDPESPNRTDHEKIFVDAVRRAQGLIIASPAYHGGISGMVKNALDLLEETSKDARTYIDGLPVGLVVTTWGNQALGATLASLRAVVHSLRGWPTPLGIGINSRDIRLDPHNYRCSDAAINAQFAVMARQLIAFTLVSRQEAHASRAVSALS